MDKIEDVDEVVDHGEQEDGEHGKDADGRASG